MTYQISQYSGTALRPCVVMQLALYSSRQDGKVGDANEANAARLSPGTTFVSNRTAALTTDWIRW